MKKNIDYITGGTENPLKILMIKGHSAGIGDLLRSSAAWRALRNRFPNSALFLLFLTKEPGYPSEPLIARHHLLNGFFTADKRTKGLDKWVLFFKEIRKVVDQISPDLVIDFEPGGLRTSLIALYIRTRYGIPTVGVNEVLFRGLFYTKKSISSRAFARQLGLDFPLEYTFKDFVALSALNIERSGIPIELEETPEGKRFREGFRQRFGIPVDKPLMGVNIGCGTPGAQWKRPDLRLLSSLVAALQDQHGFIPVLVGARFEREVNEEFMRRHRETRAGALYDLAGQTDILELAGLIKACDIFISSDSGPYHMSVALKVPTLAIFNTDSRLHCHFDPWVRCMRMETDHDLPELLKNAEALLHTG